MVLSFLKILKLEKRPTVTVSVLYDLDSCPIAYVTAVPNQDISKIEIAQYSNTHNNSNFRVSWYMHQLCYTKSDQ